MNQHTHPHRSRPWSLWAPLLIVALVAPVGLVSYQSADADDHEKESLEDVMGVISKGHKRLRRATKDAVGDAEKTKEVHGYLKDMLVAAAKSKNFEPAMVKSVPADKKAKFMAGYQMGMNVLIKKTIAIEEALLKGDQEALDKAYLELSAIKKEYHDKFIEE